MHDEVQVNEIAGLGVRPVVVVSNRGPTTFRIEAGELAAGAPAGGLARGLRPLVESTGGTWFACAVSEPDRMAAELDRPDPHIDVRLIAPDPDRYRNFYDVISNSTLWFLHHALWELPTSPRFGADWHEAWADYEAVNEEMAQVVADAAPQDAIILIQDYHFAIVAASVRARRPDVALVHFSHTPFTGPELMSVLPEHARTRLLTGLAAHDSCGFHTEKWASRFLACCDEFGVERPRTFASPLPADVAGIMDLAGSDVCSERFTALDQRLGTCRLILTSGRLELSKNLARAFNAYERLLETEPTHIGKVVFAAFVYSSRGGLPEYEAYRSHCETTADRINDRFGTDQWQPIWLDTDDDLARSVAGLRRYDVLVINPIRDGLNLVAFEGPAVNERNGVVLLSPEAGAHEQLEPAALTCPPFDIEATARQMARALDMSESERQSRANELTAIAHSGTIEGWLADHLTSIS